MLSFKSLFVAGAALAMAGLAAAEPPEEHRPVPEVRAVRAGTPIVLDGRLDEGAWSEGPAFSSFRQRDPEEGQPASERTEVHLAFDDEALYVGLRLFDREPTRIARRLSRRDDSGDADRVVVYLDPHHDHLTGAAFEVTAAGVQGDAVIHNDSWDDESWDAVWESAVALDGEGWTVEMRVPFSQIRFPEAERHTWGINVERYIQRKNESDWLELVPKKESGLASRMAHLVGLEGIRPRRAFAVLPYAVGRAELIAPASGGDPFNDGSRVLEGAGVDLKYGLSTSLTLDATINPDFGQVEVDPAVVNLTQFETFFDEKRPFFVEGAQILQNFGRNGSNNFWGFNRSEPRIFYSRRIGRSPQGPADADFVDRPPATTILGAAKLTGKTASGWSIAILETVTGREWARTQTLGLRGRAQVEPLSNYFVARAHRDIGRGGVGALSTAVLRNLDDPLLAERLPRRGYVAGLDGYRFLDAKKDWVVTGRLAFSRLEGDRTALERIQQAPQHNFQRPDLREVRLDPEATSLSGWTGALNLNRNAGNLQVNSALWATSPGFDSNDLGFNSQSDRWGGHVVGTIRKESPDRYTRSRRLSVAKWYALNFDGQRQGDGMHAFLNAHLRNYWYVGVNGFKRWRGSNDQLARGGPAAVGPAGHGAGAWFESDSRRRMTGYAEVFHSRNEFGGWDLGAFANVNVKPTSGLSVSLGPSLTRNRSRAQYVTTVEDSTAAATYGGRYVFAELRQTELALTTRINWILSPRMSFQVYAQPLVSAGAYDGFKELARPASYDFRRYGADAGTLQYDAGDLRYRADPDGTGPAPAFDFGDPDFNFRSLRVNAVFRWEWRLGSTLYVVWTQSREESATFDDFRLGRDMRALGRIPADDVLLAKFTYRFGN